MESTRADHLMRSRPLQVGSPEKVTWGPLYDRLTAERERITSGDPMGGGLSVSQIGTAIVSLMKLGHTDDASTASTFSGFIEGVHQAVLTEGRSAKVFEEVPKDGVADRITLAKQASNCLSVSYYGGEKIHDDVSARNPFAALDRLSLSRIAFDGSGTFTSVERQVAYLEMNERDVNFRSHAFDLASSQSDQHGVPWHRIMTGLADAEIASGMSDAERAWSGWGTAQGLLASAETMLRQHDVRPPPLPGYAKLKGTGDAVLAVTSAANGEVTWLNIPIKQLAADESHGNRLSLIKLMGAVPDSGANPTTSKR
ncbi:hypothetical protein [Luteibacter sp. UNCMF366Tsu5.1]|uniref:hypothetical protein n=1 Tax=Luteibacter sp. UNCMF366Tsu5.1 TaxID=1502758 RepID=UPI000930A28A|nr:hypothetical protein [Luteibacter sp. UNCMF366Tsu5.1]